jgi:hypothetical protein
MYDSRALLAESALYATTGILALSAASVPALNAFSSTSATAMDELELALRPEDAARGRAARLAALRLRRRRRAAAAARGDDRRREAGAGAGQRRAAGHRATARVRAVLPFLCVGPLQTLKRVVCELGLVIRHAGSLSGRVGLERGRPKPMTRRPLALPLGGGDCSRSHLACQGRRAMRAGRPLEEEGRSTGSGMRKNAGHAGCAGRRSIRMSDAAGGAHISAAVNANRK